MKNVQDIIDAANGLAEKLKSQADLLADIERLKGELELKEAEWTRGLSRNERELLGTYMQGETEIESEPKVKQAARKTRAKK